MKNLFSKISVARIALTVLAFSIVSVAVAQFTMPNVTSDAEYNTFQFPGVPTTMPATSFSNITASSAMTLVKDQPLSIWWGIQGSNGGLSNAVLVLRLGYGSTTLSNYATTPDLRFTNTANGTNQVKQVFYVPASNLYGARTVIPYQVANTNTNVVNIGAVIGSQYRNLTTR